MLRGGGVYWVGGRKVMVSLHAASGSWWGGEDEGRQDKRQNGMMMGSVG